MWVDRLKGARIEQGDQLAIILVQVVGGRLVLNDVSKDRVKWTGQRSILDIEPIGNIILDIHCYLC